MWNYSHYVELQFRSHYVEPVQQLCEPMVYSLVFSEQFDNGQNVLIQSLWVKGKGRSPGPGPASLASQLCTKRLSRLLNLAPARKTCASNQHVSQVRSRRQKINISLKLIFWQNGLFPFINERPQAGATIIRLRAMLKCLLQARVFGATQNRRAVWLNQTSPNLQCITRLIGGHPNRRCVRLHRESTSYINILNAVSFRPQRSSLWALGDIRIEADPESVCGPSPTNSE